MTGGYRSPGLTDDVIARAHTEYDALPGTPADSWEYRSREQIGDREVYDVIREMTDQHACEGFQWMRVTATEDGLWVEFWKERPLKEAAFDRKPPEAT